MIWPSYLICILQYSYYILSSQNTRSQFIINCLKMFAAPTASQDFQLLAQFDKKTWKEKITFLEDLCAQLPTHPHPKKIEICFLEFLREKNVNVLVKVGKLFIQYLHLYGISYISHRELAQVLIGCSSIAQFSAEDIFVTLFQAAEECQRQRLLTGLKDTIHFSEKNCHFLIKVWTKLIKNKKTQQAFCKSGKLTENLEECLVLASKDVSDSLLQFLMALSEIIGSNATVLARKIGFTKIGQLNSFILQQKFQDKVQNLDVKYIYDISTTSWIQDHQCISIKTIILSLRSAAESQQTLLLTKELLETFQWLANKKTSNISNYIYALITANIYRERVYISCAQELFDILATVISSKKINKHLYQGAVNGSLSSQEELWIGTLTEERLKEKIESSKEQEEYHRFMNLFEITKHYNKNLIPIFRQQLLKKVNLNLIYRVRLEATLKVEVEALK